MANQTLGQIPQAPVLVCRAPRTSLEKQRTSSGWLVFPAFSDKKIPSEWEKDLRVLESEQVFTKKLASVYAFRLSIAQQAQFRGIFFVGLGAASRLDSESARVAGGALWTKIHSEKASEITLDLDLMPPSVQKRLDLAAFLEGVLLAIPLNSRERPKRIIIQTKNSSLRNDCEKKLFPLLKAVFESVQWTRYWSNLPSNVGTPEFYAALAKTVGKKVGLKIEVLGEKELKKERMDLLLAVGQGSPRPSRVVILDYNPKRKSKTLALVGKGVTFDSGGISIKPAGRMEEMKHDMTGAATVFGALYLAAKMKVPNRVVGVLALVENMVDGEAIHPGNVVTGRAGKSVEIVNTDAEGRLVLADAVDYTQDKFKPDCLIDVATLTGAASVAVGKFTCPILSNSPSNISKFKVAAAITGERVWELPLYKEYLDDLKSEWADLRNVSSDGQAGTIRGAIFIQQFIKNKTPWIHLDIASTAYNVTHLSYVPKKGASGLYVRTLIEFAKEKKFQ